MDASSPAEADRSRPHDALLGLRGSITARTGVITSALILPFCLMHLAAGRYALAAVDLLAALVFGGNAWSLIARGRPVLAYPVLVTALAAAVVASVHFVGAPALYWAFPATLFFYMVLPRRQALGFCVGLVAVLVAVGALQSGASNSLRFAVTAGLTLLLLNVVLGVIGELQQQLVQQSLTDPLTGALNRRSLDARLREITAPGGGGGPARNAVLLSFDIDHFKAINDQRGHAAGDQVLRDVVRLVKARVRGSDRVFRVGGEEFVVVLDDITHDDALLVAEALRQRIAAAPLLPDRVVTVSVGLSAHTGGADADGWLRRVDAAMYEAKRQGRNRVVTA